MESKLLKVRKEVIDQNILLSAKQFHYPEVCFLLLIFLRKLNESQEKFFIID
jgi:hypothetical protein